VTRRRRHAAARARKATAALSVLAFVGIGQAIEIASNAPTTAATGIGATSVATVSPSSSASSAQRSATAAATSQGTTAKAVTTTRAS
jgi:hypothetical protein